MRDTDYRICTIEYLLNNICLHWLRRFDDYQQFAGDAGEDPQIFIDGYNELEAIYFKIKKDNIAILEDRLKIGKIIKKVSNSYLKNSKIHRYHESNMH